MSRSSTAEVRVLSLLKIEDHCLKALLVVNTMEPHSYRAQPSGEGSRETDGHRPPEGGEERERRSLK